VLVLGDDTRSFLSVVRSLGRYGLEVHAAGSVLDAPALRSRYITAFHPLPPHVTGHSAWLDEVDALVRRGDFDLVIPCHDSDILPLQAQRDRMEARGPVYLLDPEAFAATNDKLRTVLLAKELGVPTPRTHLVRSAVELREAGRELGFPLVLKPRSSFELGALHERRAVRIARSREDLERVEWRADATLLAQQYVAGRGVGVEALCDDGRILVALQHERLHEPPEGGGSSYRRTVALQPELLRASERLFSALRYTGVGMVEFRVDPDSGAWTLMEINGRFWGSLPLALAAGVDFPRYLYELLCCGRTQFPREYRLGVYARNWLADYYWFGKNLRANRADPCLLTVPHARVLKDFANLLLGREVSDTLALDDPRPAVAEARDFLRDGLAPRLRRMRPIRRALASRARRALRDAKNILFMCKGNICRSPFAERLVNDRGRARGLVARSAGSLPVVGRTAPEVAQRAASAFGVDLSGHRSSVLDRELAEWADVVFIFDRAQEAAIRALAPELLKRTHYLGALDLTGTLEVADPFGGDENRFQDTYSRITRLVDPLCLPEGPGRPAC
jgi:protein-tyrosine-phosphatase/predicted ATP-grasp superfamily ATP-dependent carboligase